ncbi:hypothetical protein C2G38_2058015 [Gigaspora rosea]|uniref:TLD-domain-containing protein n=1 Tax=Gigaspora rosea TaxID=44941 RepID=A0A397W6H9_9GLOM|nr:hypothetical protein C2G38_2058015 [Gigaspora rosea]
MNVQFFETLSNNYLDILDDTEDFNVIIKVGEPLNSKIYRAHSVVLKYRSLYFRNELAKIGTNYNNFKTISLTGISIQQFEIIIKYIYGGIILLEQYGAPFIFELMLVAYEFLLDELAKYLETHLTVMEAHWLRLHFNRIYNQSFQNVKLKKLQDWCNDIIAKYPDTIFESRDFINLQENALISLIIRDDLQMKEVKIWNNVIEWGIAQNPDLTSDSKTWSQENFLTLKTTLRNLLPLIRYFQMSADDIIDSVRPYQQILGKDLWEDISTKFMSPNRHIRSTVLPPRRILTQPLPSRVIPQVTLAQTFIQPNATKRFSAIIDDTQMSIIASSVSVIINNAQAAIIASLVDEKSDSYSVTNNPYEFKLLLRGTRDGFTAKSFWDLCNEQENVVVVMKVEGTGEILGGYNPIGWKKPINDKKKYIKCNKSFIFSLKKNIKNSICSRVNKPESAITCRVSSGPVFGKDLCMYGTFNKGKPCVCRKASSYEKSLITKKTTNFSVVEYEIFQIKKKKLFQRML